MDASVSDSTLESHVPETCHGLKDQLLEHFADLNGCKLSPSLPVDFKMTVMLFECMTQHGQLLQEVSSKVDDMRQVVEIGFQSDEFADSFSKELAINFEELKTSVRSDFDDFSYNLKEHFQDVGKLACARSAHCPAITPNDAIISNQNNDHQQDMVADDDVLATSHLHVSLGISTEALTEQCYRRCLSSESKTASIIKDGPSDFMFLGDIKIRRHQKPEDYWLRKAVSHPLFDCVCAVVIMTNAITIGISAQNGIEWAVDHPGSMPVGVGDEHPIIQLLNRCFITFYSLELVLKIWVFRCSFFYDDNWQWNLFDLLLVLAGIYDLLMEMADLDFGTGVGVTWLRILRVVKTLKLLRVIRVMRFFQVLRTMISSIAGSLNILFWTIVMLFCVEYMFALCFLQAVIMFLNLYNRADIEDEVWDGILNHWGSVMGAMATLYSAVTGGADWADLAMPIKKADSFFYSIFMFYIAFVAIAMLNVLTGMFVDTAMKVAQQDDVNVVNALLDRQEVTDYRKRVHEVMVSDPSSVSWEYVDESEDDETINFRKLLEIDAEDCRKVFKLIDTERKGFVDVEDFIKGCFHVKGTPSGLDMIFLCSETKTLCRHMKLSMKYIEDRFDELHNIWEQPCSVMNWDARLTEAKRMQREGLLQNIGV